MLRFVYFLKKLLIYLLVYFEKDFSTRSLDISEGKTNAGMRIAAENDNESSGSLDDEQHNPETDEDIKQFQMRRKWETRFTECCIFLKKLN